jgi:hypothetical protein
MTDKELLERLRDLGTRSPSIAADRIEALTAQLAEDADVRKQIDHRLEELVGQVDALTAELAEEKRMRQEEKAKILRQREQLESIQKANRNNLPMMRGLQRRVAELEAAKADNARQQMLQWPFFAPSPERKPNE